MSPDPKIMPATPNARVTFWRNTASVLGGSAIAQAVSLVGTVVLAWVYIPAHFGMFSAWLAISAVLSIVITGRFEASIATVEDGEARKIAFFATVATTIVLGSIVSVAALVATFTLPNYFGMSPFLLAALVPVSLASALARCWEHYAAAEGRYLSLSMLRIAQAVLVLTGQVVLGIFQPSPEALACAYLIGTSLTLVVSNFTFPLALPPIGTRLHHLRRFWLEQRSFPAFALPADTINTLSVQLPIILVTGRLGEDFAGHFAMAIRLLGAPMNFLGRSVLDVFKRYASYSFRTKGNCQEEYLQTLGMLAFGACIFCVVVAVFGEPIILVILGPTWASTAEMSIWLLPLFSLRFVASPLSFTFYIAKKQHVDLVWQLALLAGTFATLSALSKPEQSIKSYAAVCAVLYFAYICLSFRYSLGRSNQKIHSINNE